MPLVSERGQTTIFGAFNGGLGIQRPPPRPGPAPRASGQANTVRGRRLVGGQSEKDVLELFASVRFTVGDWQKAPEGTAENPAVIDEDGESTTDSEVESDERLDLDEEEESDFDDAIDGDEDMEDENM